MKDLKPWVAALGLAAMIGNAGAEGKEPLPFPEGHDISAYFTGTVHRRDLIEPEKMGGVPQTNVITFEPGSRSAWHTHGAMTVIGIAGLGIYQEWGKPAVWIRPGDVIEIPAGVSHWHGAAKNSRFQQFVVYDKNWKAPEGLKVHTGKVTDAEYDALKPVDAANRAGEPKGKFLFAYPEKATESPNFTKPVYISKLLGKPNAAQSPDWYYVVFPRAAFNRWHVHKTGQILIATDGVGLHQIEGGKIEVMLPGDVAWCPPGVAHWHGAAPWSSFGHIAINPGDSHTVTWKEFPESEYGSLARAKSDPEE